ncbi:MAG: hypothetical protein ACD_58C00297G0011 [uncultured bacterium]|nr:MAG: hypothetical protein ACD_58C00297G0011 [uncultured bacterium]
MKIKFRKEIFWDTDPKTIDYQKHAIYVIGKVIKWGNLSDWQELKKIYSTRKIKATVKKLCDLDNKDRNFIHMVYDIPLQQLCTKRQFAQNLSPFYNRSQR